MENDYYATMFAAISQFEVSEEDMLIPLHNVFYERPHAAQQTIPGTQAYVHINSDEMDRMLIDPAYKLEQLKLAHEKAYTMHLAMDVVGKQVSDMQYNVKMPFGRDMYESWY